MASEIIIRRMTMADVDGVAAVEAATFPTPWSRDAFASEMNNVAARYLVAEKDGRVIGFAGAWIILDESHITNIAVIKDERGQGIGRRLFSAICDAARAAGADKLYISAHSSKESQAAYRALGCVPAEEADPVRMEKEPCDVQMEYDLKGVHPHA